MRHPRLQAAAICLLTVEVMGCSNGAADADSAGTNGVTGGGSDSSGARASSGASSNSRQSASSFGIGGGIGTSTISASGGRGSGEAGVTSVAPNDSSSLGSAGIRGTDRSAATGGRAGSRVTTGGANNKAAGGASTKASMGGTAHGVSTGGTRAGISSGGISNSSVAGGARNQGGTSAAIQGGSSSRNSSAQGGAPMGGTSAASSANAITCAGSGWKLVWSDEFNGAKDSKVDSSTWVFDLGSQNGGWGNNELEYYTDAVSNVAMDGDGHLVITARKESQGGKDYTSARIKTQGKRSWKFGRVEGRIKIPKGQGIWPAFWMLGEDIATNTWPNCGEIDIMENIGKEPKVVHGSLHGPGYSGGSPLTAQTSLAEDVGDAFHLFAIEWDETSIRWYLDDKLYSTKTNKDVPSGATWVYTHPFFIILNVAVGGTWPGSPDSSTRFPQSMLVDYLRICQK